MREDTWVLFHYVDLQGVGVHGALQGDQSGRGSTPSDTPTANCGGSLLPRDLGPRSSDEGRALELVSALLGKFVEPSGWGQHGGTGAASSDGVE